MMQDFIDKKVLITTQNWFLAPDGKEYMGVYGTLKAIHEAGKTLGFIPNRSHANWFLEIGDMIIMGCQVMYITACPEEPNLGESEVWDFSNGVMNRGKRPSKIYKCRE